MFTCNHFERVETFIDFTRIENDLVIQSDIFHIDLHYITTTMCTQIDDSVCFVTNISLYPCSGIQTFLNVLAARRGG